MIGFMYPAIKAAPVSLDIQAKDIAVFALRGGPQITVKKVILTLQQYYYYRYLYYADINAKPGGRGTPGICGAFDLYCPPHPSGICLRIWVPGWERLVFMRGGMGPSHIVPCARLWRPS